MNNIFILPFEGCVTINNKITDKTKTAFDIIHKNNDLVIITSNKSKFEINDLITDLKTDGMILNNGAYFEFHNEELFSSIISINEISNLLLYGFYLEFNTLNERLRIQDSNLFKEYSSLFNIKESVKVSSLNEIKPYSLIALTTNPENDYANLFPNLDFERISQYAFEVKNKNINKSSPVELLKMKFDNYKIISFLYNKNDLDLAHLSDIIIAMENGDMSLHNFAGFITKSCANDGLYFAFDTYLRGLYEEA